MDPPVQLLDSRLTLLRRVICGATRAAFRQENRTSQAVICVVSSVAFTQENHTAQAVICGATRAAFRQENHTAQAGDLGSHQSPVQLSERRHTLFSQVTFGVTRATI